VESGSKFVRDGVDKGRFGNEDIPSVIKKIQDAGIYVVANYIFGLPDDNYDDPDVLWAFRDSLLAEIFQMDGHACRHGQILPIIISSPLFAPTRYTTLLKTLEKECGLPRCMWLDAVQDRKAWNERCRIAAYNAEVSIYLRLGNARRKRWCDIDRLDRRIGLHILEVLAAPFHPFIPLITPLHFPKTSNAFVRGSKVEPLHTD